ncbi:MAG: hypothetical protein GY952_19365 [Rhodobacteraceae bacterium]|nr:hypothetical protein [Paracoccaceae bacterium]
MKKVALAAAISLAASAAFAGSPEPVVEPVVEIIEDAGSSSQGIWLPLLVLVLVGAAVAASD